MRMSERLRLGYIGAGAFSRACIFPQLSSHNVELVGICDIIPSKAEEIAQQYGFARHYDSASAMLDDLALDAVMCVGGPKVHYEMGREVLLRGLPLYIQKPPAPTVAHAQELADLAKLNEVTCHVGFNLRSSVAVLRAAEVMKRRDGDGNLVFGRPTLGILRYGLTAGETMRAAVEDQHIHLFDLARFLLGDVEAINVQQGMGDGVRHYVVAARFSSGAVATLNFTSEQGTREFLYFEITGERGHVIESHQLELVYKRSQDPGGELGTVNEVLDHAIYPVGFEDTRAWLGYVADVANFFSAVRGEAEDRSSINSAVRSMQMCDDICAELA
jgi:myo-inositol 2-dehydrogenase/D-chiro-inositol 1-dehydrogenase